MSENSTDTEDSEQEFPELPPPVVTPPVKDEIEFDIDNLTQEQKDNLSKNTTIPIIKNFLRERKILPEGISNIKKEDLIDKLFSLRKDQTIDGNNKQAIENFIKENSKDKEKSIAQDNFNEKNGKKKGKGSTSSPTEDTPTKASTSSPTKPSTSSPTKPSTSSPTKPSTSSAQSNAKTTKNNNNNVYQNIYVITNSEAERKQALEILSKRKKTEKQQKFLNMLGRRLGGGGGGGGTPKPKRGQKERRPLVKLKVNKVNEPLPKMIFPSTTIVLAKKFSGKTNLLLNIVDKSQFDNIWIVSLTGFTGKLDSLCEDSDCLLEDVSDTMINELLKLHKEDRMNSLIVFDDVIGQVDMRSKGMQKLATMGRNFGISIIISAQDFFKVPPIWRRNSEYWYIGNLTDSNIEAVAKELSVPSFQKKRIRQELGEIARDKNHDWLYYDDRKTRFRKLFGTQFKIIV